jgi:hypothetical protein
VHRSSLLYKACSAANGVPTTLKNGILGIALTNHLIQMTLHWSSSSGGCNSSIAFTIQEKRVFENNLSHNNIPSSIKKPILLIRRHLQFIRSNFALCNYKAKICHKEPTVVSRKRARKKTIAYLKTMASFKMMTTTLNSPMLPRLTNLLTLPMHPTLPPTLPLTLQIHPPVMPTLLPALPVTLQKNKEQNVVSVHFSISIICLKYADGPKATTGEQLQSSTTHQLQSFNFA